MNIRAAVLSAMGTEPPYAVTRPLSANVNLLALAEGQDARISQVRCHHQSHWCTCGFPHFYTTKR